MRNRRLYPRFWDSDYILLKGIRTILKEVIEKYLVKGKKLKLLDFGCGDIPYKLLFENFVFEYIACDIRGNPISDIEVHFDGSIPISDQSVDLVLSIQVLEHVPDVDKYLTEANRILKKEGLLLLSTHGWWTYHPYPTDLRRWTLEGLTHDLERHSLHVIQSFWIIGMLAYSSQLRLQCFKGVLEKKGRIAKYILDTISAIYQLSMLCMDKITPEYIGKNNAAVYFVVA